MTRARAAELLRRADAGTAPGTPGRAELGRVLATTEQAVDDGMTALKAYDPPRPLQPPTP